MISGRKLLIADDSVTIQKVVDLTFTDEGMEVTTVGDGDQAIASLEQVAPDVVLADVFMPGRTGYQVCEAIKHSERFHNIPVMLLVGSFEPFDEAEARRVGADDVLTKPFQSIRQLVNRVGTLLGGKPAEGEEPTRQLSTLGLEGRLAEAGHEAGRLEVNRELNAEVTAEVNAEVMGEESPDELMSTAEIELTTADTLPLVEVESEQAEPVAYARDDDLRHSPQAEPALDVALDVAAPFASTKTASDQDRAYWAERLATESEPASQNQESEQPLRVEHMEKTSEQRRATTSADEFDDVLLDLGDLDSAPAHVALDDAVLELEDEAPEATPTSDAREAAFKTESFGSAAAPQAASLDDITYATEVEPEWAEASPIQSSQESASSEQALGAALGAAWEIVPPPVPFERITDDDSNAALDDQSALYKQQASYEPSASSQRSNMTLSPEDIDAIARRVVEHLSEKAVREIAWEVVPELAELMIKRRLEE